MLAPVSEKLRKYLGNVVVSQAEIAAAVRSLAQRIEDHYLPGDFGIVPILPKSSVFYSDLFRAIRIPVRAFPAVVISKERPEHLGGGFELSCRVYADDSGEMPSRLLVVNTIADASTADLLEFVVDTIVAEPNIESVHTCALIRTSDFKPKVSQGGEGYTDIHFSGLELDVKTDCPIVGYGQTYKGHFGQIPCLTKLKRGF